MLKFYVGFHYNFFACASIPKRRSGVKSEYLFVHLHLKIWYLDQSEGVRSGGTLAQPIGRHYGFESGGCMARPIRGHCGLTSQEKRCCDHLFESKSKVVVFLAGIKRQSMQMAAHPECACTLVLVNLM